MPCAANLEVDRGRVTLQPTMEIVSYPPGTSRFGCLGKNDAFLVWWASIAMTNGINHHHHQHHHHQHHHHHRHNDYNDGDHDLCHKSSFPEASPRSCPIHGPWVWSWWSFASFVWPRADGGILRAFLRVFFSGKMVFNNRGMRLNYINLSLVNWISLSWSGWRGMSFHWIWVWGVWGWNRLIVPIWNVFNMFFFWVGSAIAGPPMGSQTWLAGKDGMVGYCRHFDGYMEQGSNSPKPHFFQSWLF